MSDIFISYASQNREFALRLADELDEHFGIWIDREGIIGGNAWEKQIEQALKDCKIFLVLVSENSNNSEWVSRETIMAEQLKKYRIPCLLNDTLPLRLINLHYIDFRSNFEGGFNDLLKVLQAKLGDITPRTQENLYSILGQAVYARLNGNHADANSLIERALTTDKSLADSPANFWDKLNNKPKPTPARMRSDDIKIHQTSTLLKDQRYGDNASYEWSLSIDASPATLSSINHVTYHLHPTFDPPYQVVRDRESAFELRRIGWGEFTITVEIHFNDGTTRNISHELELFDG